MLFKKKNSNIIKKILSALVLNILCVFMILGYSNYFERKDIKIDFEFFGSYELNNLYRKIRNSSDGLLDTHFAGLNDKINEVLMENLRENHEILELKRIKKVETKTVFTSPIFVNFNAVIRSYNRSNKTFDEGKILDEIQKVFVNELLMAEKELKIKEINLIDRSQFFTKKLNSGIEIDANVKNSIIDMINDYDLTIYKNLHTFEIIKLTKELVKKKYKDYFILNINSEIQTRDKIQLGELIFTYLLLLNSIIFIFLRYYKFKN